MNEQESFQKRLGRINVEQPDSKEDGKAQRRRKKSWTHTASGTPTKLGMMRFPMAMIGAVLLGIVVVVLVRYARFSLVDGSLSGGESIKLTMIIDGVISVVVGLGLLKLLGAKSNIMKLLQMAGVVIMVFYMHKLVHIAPNLFTPLFSAAWVQDVLETTDPNSNLFGPDIFGEEEPVMPTILRL